MKSRSGYILAALIALSVLSACGGKGRDSRSKSAALSESSINDESRKFPSPPKAPAVMSEPDEINGYIVEHFWDEFLEKPYRCDSLVVNGVANDEVESAVGRYLTIIESFRGHSQAVEDMGRFYQKISDFQEENPSSNVYGFFERMITHYLYDPNSPVRDEDLYLPFVKGLASSSLSKENMKPAYSRAVSMCSLNQVGTRAADIVFTTLEGERSTLSSIKADLTLLFFSNPGCPSCEEVINTLMGNEKVKNLLSSGKLAVVNLYIDLEREKWEEMARAYPKTWINAYDQDYKIRQDLTYNIRAIPSLYVLDKEKVVVMKDAPVEKVVSYIENI